MKRINYILIMAIVAGSIATSCSSKIYSTRQTPILRESIPANPIIADMDVDISKKITGEAIVKGGSATIDNAKQMALWQAMEDNKADVVVDPIFSLVIKKGIFRKKINAKVMGYKGSYSDVHVASENEIKNLLIYREAQPMFLQNDGSAGKGKFFSKLLGK